MARTTYLSVSRRLEMRPSMEEVGRSQAIGPVKVRRDATALAMRGWHSQRLLSNGYVGDSLIKVCTSKMNLGDEVDLEDCFSTE
ncbi:AT-rich interactive domain-containing protein 5-like [Magnolia sinica]|uniref:AT-rich interactive domain-containing protein 5-like n=1 Tax=Magnolia sinica TaxID=86752 RepID=UPI002659EAED|nr:AT-rich interactive domain-containing protein 5-like [Magnolia sinica]